MSDNIGLVVASHSTEDALREELVHLRAELKTVNEMIKSRTRIKPGNYFTEQHQELARSLQLEILEENRRADIAEARLTLRTEQLADAMHLGTKTQTGSRLEYYMLMEKKFVLTDRLLEAEIALPFYE
jgi:paraquat-inducible protein B